MEREYFNWLIAFIDPLNKVGSAYQPILEELYLTDFRIKRGFEDDRNRAMDGLYLRVDFAEEHGVYSAMRDPDVNGCYADIDEWIGISGKSCSCLEMLIALAKKIEREFYGDPEDIPAFFWYFLNNLGIGDNDDEISAARKVRCWLMREYSKDGSGGIFVTKRRDVDMRERPIWSQLSICLVENGGVLW